MTRALIGSALGGLIGAALWAAIAFLFNFEFGWIAWGVGCLAGFGAAKSGNDLDFTTGVAAAGIAVLAIALGKYVTVHVIVNDLMEELAVEGLQVDDELAISFIADDVVLEFDSSGRLVNWPGGSMPENPTMQAEYPSDVWSLAMDEWSTWQPSEQREFKDQIRAQGEANMGYIEEAAMQAGFRESFSGIDILFLLLAMASAYKIGSGSTAKA